MIEFANVYFLVLKSTILGLPLLMLLLALFFSFFFLFLPFFICKEKADHLLEYAKMISGYNKLTAKEKRIHETFIHPKYWYDDRKVYAKLTTKEKRVKKTIIYTKVTLLYILGGIGSHICLCIWGFIIYSLNLNNFHELLFFVE
jgi:hypothetical protein